MIPVSQPTLPELSVVTANLHDSFQSGHITNGNLVLEFEEKLATMIGAKYACATSSNTLGMVLTWKSFCFDEGAEVILPSFTFPASAHALTWNNLKPVFADIDPKTYLLDPTSVEAAITDKTVAILGVTLWGNPCDDVKLAALARTYNLALVYDSAQGMGSKSNARFLGTRGDAEIFSFSPTKLITTCEGGAVVTNNKKIADFIRSNRNYGLTPAYDSPVPGLNARMSEMHAAVGLSCFPTMKNAIKRRLEIAQRYTDELSNIPGITFQAKTESTEGNGVYFGVFIDSNHFGCTRDQLASELRKGGIQTRSYGSPALHALSCYAHLDTAPLPHTNRAAQQVLVLPLFSHIRDSQVTQVIEAIKKIHTESIQYT